MANYFYDWEFEEDGKTIKPISLGMVKEDGTKLYRCNKGYDTSKATDWLKKNVVPHLPPKEDPRWVSLTQMRDDVLGFIGQDRNVVLWARYGDYDHVCFAQLWGRMIDLPEHVPKLTMDLKQVEIMLGGPEVPKQEGTEHDALADAMWNRRVYFWLKDYAKRRLFANTLHF